MDEIVRRILDNLRARGYPSRIVSVSHVSELKGEIEDKNDQGLFDHEFYKIWLQGFSFEPPDEIENAESLIIAAVPHPKFGVTFRAGGRARSFVIPPTYLHYTDKLVAEALRGVLEIGGHHLTRTVVPYKLLLGRSGLGRYGRNNVTYIKGLGSYYRLSAFYSDLPCDDDNWQDAEMLEECLKCTACVRACPTGAIATDRFLLHAERCIPFFNERDVEFPEWMDPSWHNSLIGCMACQDVCPVDNPFKNWVEDRASFTEEETGLILEGVPFDSHSQKTQEKLREIEWTEDLDIFARNLRLLLARGCSSATGKKSEK